jgi:7,8-dihydro-6-hydroxymethylpterin-pyrophosphokinase
MLQSLLSRISPAFWRPGDEKHVAAIAFGSNLGDRLANIEHALRLLEDDDTLALAAENNARREDYKLYIIDTSFLYETAPMYVQDQPDFMNGACLVSVALHLVGEWCSNRLARWKRTWRLCNCSNF